MVLFPDGSFFSFNSNLHFAHIQCMVSIGVLGRKVKLALKVSPLINILEGHPLISIQTWFQPGSLMDSFL